MLLVQRIPVAVSVAFLSPEAGAQDDAIAIGGATGRTSVHKFGYASAVPSSEVDVWMGHTVSANYPWATTAEAVRVRAGGNANDTAAGTGARQVTVVGLDGGFAEVTDALTTAGASASSPTAQQFIRVNRVYVSSVGTYAAAAGGGANAGNLLIEGATSGALYVFMAAGFGESRTSMFTVPAGKIALLRSLAVSVDGNQRGEVTLWSRPNADDVSVPYAGAKRIVARYSGLAGHAMTTYAPPVAFPAKTDLWASASSAAGTTNVSVDYGLVVYSVQ